MKTAGMNVSKPSLWLEYIFTRAFVSYLVMFGLSFMIIDYNKGQAGLEVRFLEKQFPDITYIRRSVEGKTGFHKEPLKYYVYFYQNVIDYQPKSADAYTMLGFCYYHLGKQQEAVEAYRKAIHLNPRIFWPYYNLGIIYYNQGDLHRARVMFDEAFKTKPKETLEFVDSSKRIYRPLLGKNIDLHKEYQNRLLYGMHNLYRLRVLNYYNLQRFESAYAEIEKAVALQSPYKDFHYFYAGMIRYLQKHYAEALAFFQESVKGESAYLESYVYIAKCIEHLGDREGASKVKEKLKDMKNLGKFSGSARPQADYTLRMF